MKVDREIRLIIHNKNFLTLLTKFHSYAILNIYQSGIFR